MSQLSRIVLVRHGETEGESSIRFHGSRDVALAATGRDQMQAIADLLANDTFDVVAASPLRRSWQSAWIVSRGAPVSLVPEFREVNFGRWEGLTREEIQAMDPVLYEDWQAGAEDFEYPGGDSRADFKARVLAGLPKLHAGGGHSALLVVHKGVIRVIAEAVTGEVLDREVPALGEMLQLTREANGNWFVGRRSSDPPALAQPA